MTDISVINIKSDCRYLHEDFRIRPVEVPNPFIPKTLNKDMLQQRFEAIGGKDLFPQF